MNIIQFYTKILKSFGLTVTEDGFIKGGTKTLQVNGKPVCLPTKDTIKDIMVPDGSGKLVASKVIFNPLKESPIKGDSVGLNRLKAFGTINISSTVLELGNLLLTLATSKDLKEAPLELSPFLVSLKDARGNATVVVDEGTLKAWNSISTKSLANPKAYPVKLFLKKGVKLRGEKYNRGLVISSPLLELFEDDDFLDVKLRKKDVKTFKILLKYILDIPLEEPVVSITNNGTSPGLVALLKGYKKIMDDLNGKIRIMKFMDPDVEDTVTDVLYTYDEASEVSVYKTDLAVIPDINDDGTIGVYSGAVDVVESAATVAMENAATTNTNIANVNNSMVTHDDTELSTEDIFDKVLHNSGNANTMMPPPPPVFGGQQQHYPPQHYQQQYAPQQQFMQQQYAPPPMNPVIPYDYQQPPYMGGTGPTFGGQLRPSNGGITRMY